MNEEIMRIEANFHGYTGTIVRLNIYERSTGNIINDAEAAKLQQNIGSILGIAKVEANGNQILVYRSTFGKPRSWHEIIDSVIFRANGVLLENVPEEEVRLTGRIQIMWIP